MVFCRSAVYDFLSPFFPQPFLYKNTMNSLKDYSLNISEDAYHAYPAWSHSLIARYAREGFGCIPTLHDKFVPNAAMEFGSLFDSIMTRGRQTLEDYYVMDVSVPEAERKTLDYISTCTDSTMTFSGMTPKYIFEKANECGYQAKWGEEAKYKHLSPYADYYDVKKSGKKIVSQKDWDDAMDMARVFRNDDYLKTIFGTKNTKDIEYLYQLQFCEEVALASGKVVKVKIMPDLLVVNHKDKTIQPVDLKTSTNPGWSFDENFVRMRYDLEASVYSDILSLVIDKDTDLLEYTILPYLFTDISRSDKVAVTFVYPQNDDSQRNGFCFTRDGKTYKYKSWMTLLDEILAYEETEAKVPTHISLDGPNNILDLLNK